MLSGAVAEAARSARDEEAGTVEVTELARPEPAADAVGAEAAKGYDLLVVGIDPTVAPEGGLADAVAAAAERFDGPLAIAAARGPHRDDPERAALSVLAVIDGTRAARRGAEIAVTLARSAGAPLTVLFVSEGKGRLAGLRQDDGDGVARGARPRREGRAAVRTEIPRHPGAGARDPAPGAGRRPRPDRDRRHPPRRRGARCSGRSPRRCWRPRLDRSVLFLAS